MIVKDKEEAVGFLLARSTNILWRELQRNFSKEGFVVTPEQFSIMMKIYHQGAMSQKELAESTFKDKVSITKIVNTLEKNGYVVRENDSCDKRIKRIFLTNKSEGMLPKLHKIAHETITYSMGKTTKKERETFKSVLRNIYQNLSV